MATVIEWNRTPNPQVVAKYALQAVREGHLIVSPSESGYHLVGSTRRPDAIERALQLAESGSHPVIPVLDIHEARDWVPELSALASRVGRRFWPGPLTIRFLDGFDSGIGTRLSKRVFRLLGGNESLQVRTPCHPFPRGLIERATMPLVFVPLTHAGDPGTPEGDPSPTLSRVASETNLIILDGIPEHETGASILELKQNEWSLVRSGAISAETLTEKLGCSIVFLCTGNTCRSPMAQGLFEKKLSTALGCEVSELRSKGYSVQSAGLAAAPGGPAAREAIEVGQSYGADLSQHRSQPISEKLLREADYLIGMTRSHVQAVEDHFPNLTTRPRLLCTTGEDLADPVGQSVEVYRACAGTIWDSLDELLRELDVAPPSTEKPEQVEE